MKKIYALCLTVLLCFGVSAQFSKLRKADASKPAANAEVLARVNSVVDLNTIRSSVAKGGATEIQSSAVNPKFANAKRKAMNKANVTTDKLIGERIYPAPNAFGTAGLDGSFVAKTNNGDYQSATMGVANGKLYTFNWIESNGSVYGAQYQVIDLDTWTADETLNFFSDPNLNFSNDFIQIGAFVPEDNAFYGVTNNGWAKFDVETETTEILGEIPSSTWSSTYCYNGNIDAIVGISPKTGKLVKYDKNTGESTVLAESTDAVGTYIGGFAYDIESNNYIFNICAQEGCSLVAIDADTFEVSEICAYSSLFEWGNLVCYTNKPADPEAPLAAEFTGANFVDASYTGTVSFKLPTELNNGNAISGKVDYVFSINGKEYTKGNGNAGAVITVDVKKDADLKDGVATFSVVCSKGNHTSKVADLKKYIGNDTPSAPQNVRLTVGTVSWDAVTTGAHNGYINPSEVTYTVKVNGKVVATGVTDTFCDSGIAANKDLNSYVAEVVAVFKGYTSAPGKSNSVVYGEGLSLPATFGEDDAHLFQVYDANRDGKSWQFVEDTAGAGWGTAWRYSYNMYAAGDDWLFLPPVAMTNVNEFVKFSMKAWAYNANYPEKFEVYIGSEATPAAMTTKLIDATEISNTYANVQTFEKLFTVNAPGKYYVGIHAISKANQYYLYVNDFELSQTKVSKTGPAAVTDVVVTPGAKGALNAKVEFKLPTVDNSGNALKGTVKAVVKGSIDEKTVTGAPGAKVSVNLETVQSTDENGENKISIQTFQGETEGMIIYVNAWCGVDLPGLVRNLSAEMYADNISGKLTWLAPNTGANGGYVNESGYNYYKMEYVSLGTIFGIPIGGWQITDTIGKDVLEYEFTLSEMTQQRVQLGVLAENEAGMSPSFAVVNLFAGTPYDVPAVEDFSNVSNNSRTFNYSPVMYGVTDATANPTATLAPCSNLGTAYTGAPNNYVFAITTDKATDARIYLPKFSTKNYNKVAFIPNLYIGCNKAYKIYATADGIPAEELLLDTRTVVNLGSGYQDVVVDLPAKFQNKAWVQLFVVGEMTATENKMILGGYKLRNMVAKDMLVGIRGVNKANVGETAYFSVVVENVGLNNVTYTGGKFTVTAEDGTVADTKVVKADEVLAQDEATFAYYNFVPQIENIGKATVKFELLASDDNNLNNSASLECEIVKGNACVVDDLVGTNVEDGIDLTWSAATYVNADGSFENLAPFVLSGNEVGPFANITNDEDVYSWGGVQSNAALASLLAEVAYKPGFNVFNGPQLSEAFGEEGMFAGADGDQFVIAFCPGDGSAADSWLVTPEIKGDSEFSFQARELVTDYGAEVIEICYATENTLDVTSYQVLKTIEVGEVEWTTYSVKVPADAKRVAIHYVSEDVFGICLDDIKFAGVKEAISVLGYEIWRQAGDETEWTKIGYVQEPGYLDAEADRTVENRYYVIPWLSDESYGSRSNIAIVAPTGIFDVKAGQAISTAKNEIVINGFAGEKVVIATADGKVVANVVADDMNRVSVPAGIYVVKAGKKTVKVVVM